MRLLLISDTHGKLDIINELSAQTQADAVIHAGDFGFYDDESFERLSDRELRLHVTHSDLPRAEKDNLLALSRIDLIAQARMLRLLGEFRSYIDGGNSFQVPVYAVWGNHEDKDVVERLFNGDVTIANLHMLHHRQGYRVGPAYVYGLGGNLLPGLKMMQRPIAGGGGKIWSTLSQYAELVQMVEKESAPDGPRLFVSHVSREKNLSLLDEHRIGEHRLEGDHLLADRIEVALLAHQHGAAHGIDDVVVALGIDDLAVAQGIGVGGELVLDLQVLGWKDDLLALHGAVDQRNRVRPALDSFRTIMSQEQT